MKIHTLLIVLILIVSCHTNLDEVIEPSDCSETEVSSETVLNICDNKLNVIDLGADPTGVYDSSNSFYKAICSIKERGHGVLFIPKGRYRLSNIVEVQAACFLMSILGEGVENSILMCDNDLGCIRLTALNRSSQITMNGFSFLPLKENSGTAFEFTMPSGGNRANRSCIINDICVNSFENNSFNNGLLLTGQWRSLIQNVSVVGLNSYNNDTFIMQRAIDVSGSFTPRVENCIVRNTNQGIVYEAGVGEGGDFISNCLFNCIDGLYTNSNGVEPQTNIRYNKFDCLKFGIRLESRKLNFIIENEFFNSLNNMESYVDIRLGVTGNGKQNMTNTLIINNKFINGESSQRKMISLGNKVSDVFIEENYFDTRGTVLTDEYNAQNVILKNNIFSNKVDQIY